MEDIWIEWGSVEIRWRQERQRHRQRQQWKQFPRCNMTINRWRRRWQQHRHEPTPLPLCHPFMTLAVTYHLRLCAYAHMWETFQFRVMGGKRLNQMTISWRRHVCSNLLTTTLMHGMTTTHMIATNNITTEGYIKRVQSKAWRRQAHGHLYENTDHNATTIYSQQIQLVLVLLVISTNRMRFVILPSLSDYARLC